MKKIFSILITVLCLNFLSLAEVATAHHSFAMFDASKEQIIVGKVQRWAFNNPHAWLYIEVTDESGDTQTWGFEGAAQVHAMRQGVNGTTFKPGEKVKVIMNPLKSGEPAGAMCFVQKEDGSFANPNDATCNSEERISVWQRNGWLNSANFSIYDVE